MKDWKWASVNGWPDLMMAARSHSMSSETLSAFLILPKGRASIHAFVEIALVKIVRPRNIHVV